MYFRSSSRCLTKPQNYFSISAKFFSLHSGTSYMYAPPILPMAKMQLFLHSSTSEPASDVVRVSAFEASQNQIEDNRTNQPTKPTRIRT
mmetsp:Transcript_4395/g.9551  ORF Transcript_4395/g.9551 Transcript_4395/m.9551 type:complete len:89 (-) Transcript_4395:284-550(-)